jgi:prophage regulatory protein
MRANDPILNKKTLINDLQISGSTIDRLEKEGKFPRRLSLSARRVGWISSQIEARKLERQRTGGLAPTEQGA